ncbi:GNAT family N-acetyltransferase [Halomonas sp. 141]|uniref:GNAT family N-acetyltransferase n=1 Tax=Halomonas sp. 141 TaxID=2056666 RepID=UPI000C2AE38E|nr:GNAT family N-acetyltransferase [Halomonas sp. 141]PJX14599.1 GNAT family N-acetyltransferase [Halomonas sp. 141]
MNIRHVIEEDFSEITDILNYYIIHSDARYFEPEPVSVRDRESWIYEFGEQTPCQMLVAENDSQILGFCCAQKYRPEPAYDKTVEVSVYVSPKSTSRGVGGSLYGRLFASLEAFDLHRALAGIALPNNASLAFHQKFGFEEVGTFDEYGVKGGRFISAI